jgi:hypothetical protein
MGGWRISSYGNAPRAPLAPLRFARCALRRVVLDSSTIFAPWAPLAPLRFARCALRRVVLESGSNLSKTSAHY